MTVLSANHIYKSFGEKQVLNDVSVCLNEGELVSLLGVSGGGKTTLFNVLSGIYLPDSGEAGKVSYMLQKDLLLPYKKVIDNVSLPLLINGKSKKEVRETAGTYFEIFGLDGTQEMYPDALSGGMRQRAALLRTYLASEGVALLDEPFSALDTITKSRMHKWYLEIMKEINLSTLFITHDIDEAILLSDRIYILNGGRITQETVIDSAEKRNPDFNLTGEFLEYKKKIKSFLE